MAKTSPELRQLLDVVHDQIREEEREAMKLAASRAGSSGGGDGSDEVGEVPLGFFFVSPRGQTPASASPPSASATDARPVPTPDR